MKINANGLIKSLDENLMLIDWNEYFSKEELSLYVPRLDRYVKNNRVPIKYLRNFNIIPNRKTILLTARNKIIKISLFITKDFAYFFGYLCGDGSVESNGNRINFSDESFEQMVRINRLSKKLFNVKGTIYSRRPVLSKKPVYALEIRSKVLNSLFSDYFGFPRGKKHNLRIPNLFFSHKKLLKNFLIGLFDADGTLPKNPKKCKQLFIDIAMKDKCMVEDIKKALLLFGIETLKLYPRKSKSPNSDKICITWELRIRRKSQIERFLIEIGFSHPDKGNRDKKLKFFLRL